METGYYVIEVTMSISKKQVGDGNEPIESFPYKHVNCKSIHYGLFAPNEISTLPSSIIKEEFHSEESDENIIDSIKKKLPNNLIIVEDAKEDNAKLILKDPDISMAFLEKVKLNEGEIVKKIKDKLF